MSADDQEPAIQSDQTETDQTDPDANTPGCGKSILVATGVIFVLLVIVAIANDDDDPSPSFSVPDRATNTPRRAEPTRVTHHRVIYRVTSSQTRHPISLTYENQSGNTEQLETRTSNNEWRRTLSAEPGQFLYVSVQNQEDSGSVECEIVINGVVVEQARSEGGYVIATCSGSAPR